MASIKQRTWFSTLMVIMIVYQLFINCESVTTKKLWDLKQKGTIKTIERKNGEVIDCVDMYKQIAFDHPLIKDLQIAPSSYPDGIQLESSSMIDQLLKWFKNEECDEGTVPIRRSGISRNHKKSSGFAFIQHQYYNQSFQEAVSDGHEYALVSNEGSPYYGAQVSINVWNPITENNEISLSQIWIASWKDDMFENVNTIEAGWIVNPSRYGDNQTRFFIYWTADGYKKTGCYDLDCPGFVQTNQKFVIGSPIKPVSKYDGKQFEITITIFKDNVTGNWWLHVNGASIGYWPNSIFTTLADHATVVNWGGEIMNSKPGGHHTTTQMGSGHFSSEDYGKSCFMHNLKVVDSANVLNDPGYMKTMATNPACYDISNPVKKSGDYGMAFYYGGLGYSSSCN